VCRACGHPNGLPSTRGSPTAKTSGCCQSHALRTWALSSGAGRVLGKYGRWLSLLMKHEQPRMRMVAVRIVEVRSAYMGEFDWEKAEQLARNGMKV
jgi:hypothetical protein